MLRRSLGGSRNFESFCREKTIFQTKQGSDVSVLVLVIDNEPDVEALFRQQFRRDLRAQRFVMDFAVSASDALSRVAGNSEQPPILILSDINMPGMTGVCTENLSSGVVVVKSAKDGV
jgi:response regulator RpfG family c-di-GMP phosphodiesterase